jgi:O-antigen/teichoic acid export membrane protein
MNNMINSIFNKFIPSFIRKKVELNPELRKIIGNINWLVLERVLRNLLALFVVAWVARYLGPEQFGLMNYALSFVALFSALSIMGLNGITVRNIVSNPENKEEYLGTTLLLKFFGSLSMLIISVIGIALIEPDNTSVQLFVLIVALGYIFKSFDTIDLWFQSQVQSKYSVFSRSIAFVIISILKIGLVITQAPLVAFVLMYALDNLLAALLLIYLYHKKVTFSFFEWQVKYDVMKSLLKDSWPLILSGIAVMLYMKIDQVMIGNMLGDPQLGVYSAAVKLSEAWYFIPMIVSGSVFPAILNTRKKSRELYLERMQMLYDSFTSFTIFVALITTFIAPFVIHIIYGVEYIEAAAVLSIHIWAGIFVFLGVASSKYLVAENLTKISFYRTFIGAITNLTLNFILIPEHGILGAAIATLISQMLSSYVLNALFKKSKIAFIMQSKSFNLFRVWNDLSKIYERNR